MYEQPWVFILSNKNTIAFAIAFIAIIFLAAAMRLPQLELRPVHGDEANQAMKTGILLEKGEYAYDPHEHHGPTLYYFTLPVMWISGVSSFAESSITHYRIVTVIFGLLTILLLWPMRQALGNWAVFWSALLLAVSHVMTYYSRYYIQEMLFVCFIQAAFAAGWRLYNKPSILWAILFGISLGLVHATKETSLFVALSMAAGILLVIGYSRIRDKAAFKEQLKDLFARKTALYFFITCAAALLVSFTLFSSFFTHWRGPLDSLLTYTHYLTRAEGAGSAAMHDKPWYYYLVLLAYTYKQAGPRWTEAFTLLLALVGLGTALWPRIAVGEEQARAQQFRRFLAFYAVIILILYSAVPYKTPWNLLVFYHAAALLAGIGASAIVRVGRWHIAHLVVAGATLLLSALLSALISYILLYNSCIGESIAKVTTNIGKITVQVLLCLLLLAGTAHMGYQSYQGNFIYPADARNPYVYAHPSTAIRRIITRIEDITAVADESYALHINIIRPDGDYWPLPWYLRKHIKVGWWRRMPDHPDAAIILASPELHDLLQERLKDDYMVEFHALRPGFLLHAYIRRDLWNAFMQTRQ